MEKALCYYNQTYSILVYTQTDRVKHKKVPPKDFLIEKSNKTQLNGACDQIILQSLDFTHQQCQAFQYSSIKTRYLLFGSE